MVVLVTKEGDKQKEKSKKETFKFLTYQVCLILYPVTPLMLLQAADITAAVDYVIAITKPKKKKGSKISTSKVIKDS